MPASDQIDPGLSPAERLAKKKALDQAKRAYLGEGPGELMGAMGFYSSSGAALSALDHWCVKYRQLGALTISSTYEYVLEQQQRKARTLLKAALALALEISDRNVPRDTGWLAASRSSALGLVGEGATLAIIRYSATYAAIVHEEPAEARVSGQPKWLENALMHADQNFNSDLEQTLRRNPLPPAYTPTLVAYDSVHGRLRIEHRHTPLGHPFQVGRDPKGRFRSLRAGDITPIYE
jgi:hypothetical protein